MKVFFASSLFSPFQVELVRELNAQIDGTFVVAFTVPARSARGQPHWRTVSYDDLRERVMPAPDGLGVSAARAWLSDQIAQAAPDIILCGAVRGPTYAAATAACVQRGIPLGFWLEPPYPLHSRVRRWLTPWVMRRRLRHARFVLAIGDRAEQFYRGLGLPVECVPYGQDLSACLRIDRRPIGKPVRFVFSGQLVARHNIHLIMTAFLHLSTQLPGSARLVIAGYGPEQRVIDAIMAREPRLRALVEFDRDFATWEDRLRPFREGDVLLYPSAHSGWGLVVPEAMASGMCVITTRNVEAARYFVRHNINGFLVEPSVEAVVGAMATCVQNPAQARAMGTQARQDALAGHAPQVAAKMLGALASLVGRDTYKRKPAQVGHG